MYEQRDRLSHFGLDRAYTRSRPSNTLDGRTSTTLSRRLRRIDSLGSEPVGRTRKWKASMEIQLSTLKTSIFLRFLRHLRRSSQTVRTALPISLLTRRTASTDIPRMVSLLEQFSFFLFLLLLCCPNVITSCLMIGLFSLSYVESCFQ